MVVSEGGDGEELLLVVVCLGGGNTPSWGIRARNHAPKCLKLEKKTMVTGRGHCVHFRKVLKQHY